MDKRNGIGDKLIDYLSGKGQSSKNEELSDWMEQSDDNKQTVGKYRKIWNAVDHISDSQSFAVDNAWKSVDQSIRKQQIRVRKFKNALYTVSGMAASIVLILSFSFYFNLFSSTENQLAFTTETGSRSQVVLPDGSKLKLNAQTSVEYQFNKISKTREVIFSGEGYFEVAKSDQPFIIKTKGGMSLEVLGTKFNLSAYPDDAYVETALIEGSVELSNHKGDELVMTPGQTAQFNNTTKQLQFINEMQENKLGWMSGRIYLEDTSLGELKKKLERWYGVTISLSPNNIGNDMHYSGVLEEETIQDVLSAMKELSAINYTIKGKDIVITKTKANE